MSHDGEPEPPPRWGSAPLGTTYCSRLGSTPRIARLHSEACLGSPVIHTGAAWDPFLHGMDGVWAGLKPQSSPPEPVGNATTLGFTLHCKPIGPSTRHRPFSRPTRHATPPAPSPLARSSGQANAQRVVEKRNRRRSASRGNERSVTRGIHIECAMRDAGPFNSLSEKVHTPRACHQVQFIFAHCAPQSRIAEAFACVV